jgi:hypothetical protein
MPIVIAIGIANLWVGSDGGSAPPVGLCFADTNWNIFDGGFWNTINTNWNNCL